MSIGPELAAVVTNCGGMGVLGGAYYTPKILSQQIQILKENLTDKNAPFGVDLLLPQIGGSARKTNFDYTKGHLSELLDIIIREKAALFVSAVGVPPKMAVDRLHAAGIPIMNMVGHPKHVKKALAAGVDLICAQAGEGGGHTGEIPASVLIPACVDAVQGHFSPLTGKPVHVVGAGAVFDGRGLAANLAWGAQAVWVGTRFVASVEAGAPKIHKELVLKAKHGDVVRTLVYSGRPMRVFRTPFVDEWETRRQEEMHSLLARGIIPEHHELEKHPEKTMEAKRWLMGEVAALIGEVLPAEVIIKNMVSEAVGIMQRNYAMISERPLAKL